MIEFVDLEEKRCMEITDRGLKSLGEGMKGLGDLKSIDLNFDR